MLRDLIDEAAQILAFTPKAGVPTAQVAGKKYVLSNYWPAMSMSDEEGTSGGAKLIKGPDPDKFRYLWALDTEKKMVRMWRFSDGDEKVSGSDRQLSSDLLVLSKKGQLNRVTSDELKAIEKAMNKKTDDTLSSLRASIDANKDDVARDLDAKLQDRADRVVRPAFFKSLGDIKQGVTPIGFKPFGDAVAGNAWWVRQAASHVLGLLWKKEMSEKAITAWLTAEKFPVDQLGNQDIDFATNDLYYTLGDEWLPKRP
jgi:hypothetical protein